MGVSLDDFRLRLIIKHCCYVHKDFAVKKLDMLPEIGLDVKIFRNLRKNILSKAMLRRPIYYVRNLKKDRPC